MDRILFSTREWYSVLSIRCTCSIPIYSGSVSIWQQVVNKLQLDLTKKKCKVNYTEKNLSPLSARFLFNLVIKLKKNNNKRNRSTMVMIGATEKENTSKRQADHGKLKKQVKCKICYAKMGTESVDMWQRKYCYFPVNVSDFITQLVIYQAKLPHLGVTINWYSFSHVHLMKRCTNIMRHSDRYQPMILK